MTNLPVLDVHVSHPSSGGSQTNGDMIFIGYVARGELSSQLPRAAPDLGEGLRGDHPGGLRQRGVHAFRGQDRPGHGRERRFQEPGRQALRGARRAGVRLPRAADRGGVALSVARRDLPEVAGGPEDHEPRDDHRRRGEPGDRLPRDPGGRDGGFRGRDLLACRCCGTWPTGACGARGW